jgi:hypothetical protein
LLLYPIAVLQSIAFPEENSIKKACPRLSIIST